MTELRLAVIACSVGRPECLKILTRRLHLQTRPAERILFVVPSLADVGGTEGKAMLEAQGCEVVLSEKGLPRQRNAGLDALGCDADIVCFFDDDFLPARDALEKMRMAFAQWPKASGMTGHLIKDGIHGPGVSPEEAEALLARWEAEQAPQAAARIIHRGLEGLYGCNMVIRMADIGAIRFDERLPLYGWQEDIDFAAQLPGERIKTDAFAGVHLGIKSGRETAGKRLGYSQVANTWYLWRKGTMSARFAGKLAFRNIVANHLKMARPEPWIDRRSRAAGNRLALWEILLGRARPERILTL